MGRTSVVDVPKRADEVDQFGMDKYQAGLIKFIEKANTPITVALQGEWGSGKTSLMNTLKNKLSDEKGKRFHAIWLNTWQYSLMREPEEALVGIIKALTEMVIQTAVNPSPTLATKLSKSVSNLANWMAPIGNALVNKTTGIDLEKTAKKLAAPEAEVTVSQLRDSLNQTIKGIVEEQKKDGFIFFIDDLDRIDPPVAVQILELLKNIFDLENCVFVLAIDYDVVIKGLEPKFGKLTEKNEREFRSFFDKIIQLPFSMPVGNYSINNFLVENLKAIEFINEKQAKDLDFAKTLSDITKLAVGTNPRAIKRLLNSLSLISCINAAGKDEETNDLDVLVNFALVNLQIAYPPIYRILAQYPDFPKWNNTIALQMNLPAIDEAVQAKLVVQTEFNEEWEQIVFRLCERDFYLKKKALNVSRLLNLLRDKISGKATEEGVDSDNTTEQGKEDIGGLIASLISLSSVTSLEAFDKPVLDYHRGSLLKKVRLGIIPKLKEKMPEIANHIREIGGRVQTNAHFTLSEIQHLQQFKIHSWPDLKLGKIIMELSTSGKWLGVAKPSEENLRAAGVLDEYNNINKELEAISARYPEYEFLIPPHHLWQWKNEWHTNFVVKLLGDKPDDFYTAEFFDSMSDLIVSFSRLIERYNILSENIKRAAGR